MLAEINGHPTVLVCDFNALQFILTNMRFLTRIEGEIMPFVTQLICELVHNTHIVLGGFSNCITRADTWAKHTLK